MLWLLVALRAPPSEINPSCASSQSIEIVLSEDGTADRQTSEPLSTDSGSLRKPGTTRAASARPNTGRGRGRGVSETPKSEDGTHDQGTREALPKDGESLRKPETTRAASARPNTGRGRGGSSKGGRRPSWGRGRNLIESQGDLAERNPRVLTTMIKACGDLTSLQELALSHSDFFNYINVSAMMVKVAKAYRENNAEDAQHLMLQLNRAWAGCFHFQLARVSPLDPRWTPDGVHADMTVIVRSSLDIAQDVADLLARDTTALPSMSILLGPSAKVLPRCSYKHIWFTYTAFFPICTSAIHMSCPSSLLQRASSYLISQSMSN
eukprot:gene13891-19818_t